MTEINRRAFVFAGTAAGLALPRLAHGSPPPRAESPTPDEGSAVQRPTPEEYPSQDVALARDIVGASHANLARVKELVSEKPETAKASYDWGFGDWETAIDAASHTGQREIVALLIANGARPTLFTYAMLGNLDVVRAAIDAQPGIQTMLGPHGINLLRHAQAGGDAAKEVAAYLQSIGGADGAQASVPMTDEQKQAFVGRYRFGPGERDAFDVAIDRRGDLAMERIGGSARRMVHKGEDAFSAAGADSLRIRFARQGGGVHRLTVHDPVPVVTAVRE